MVRKAVEIVNKSGNHKKNINIYVDNQAAIKAITPHPYVSENILRSSEVVDVAAAKKKLQIYGLPGQKTILGSYIAKVPSVRLSNQKRCTIKLPKHLSDGLGLDGMPYAMHDSKNHV